MTLPPVLRRQAADWLGPDNDELSGLIASMMDVQALVILSNIDGVYDGDPSLPGSSLIADIRQVEDAGTCPHAMPWSRNSS